MNNFRAGRHLEAWEAMWKPGKPFGSPGGHLEAREAIWKPGKLFRSPGGHLEVREVIWKPGTPFGTLGSHLEAREAIWKPGTLFGPRGRKMHYFRATKLAPKIDSKRELQTESEKLPKTNPKGDPLKSPKCCNYNVLCNLGLPFGDFRGATRCQIGSLPRRQFDAIFGSPKLAESIVYITFRKLFGL